jgi:transglutaminase-like putative cysteine protease
LKRVRILHQTHYRFSAAVALGQHELRLRPRESHELRIEMSMLRMEPTPRLRWYRDIEDNSVGVATFHGTTTRLTIVSEVVVQQYNLRPFDFLIAHYAASWPFRYSSSDATALGPYILVSQSAQYDEELDHWLGSAAAQLERNADAFMRLQHLNAHIHRGIRYRVREEEGVQTPGQTVALGSGACRDLAALFMEAARRMGLGARFVSGYLKVDTADIAPGATHAWAEAYLPGAGWLGFDPTLGTLAGPDHFAVATARMPDSIPPVSGSFSGNAVSRLDVGVQVTEL